MDASQPAEQTGPGARRRHARRAGRHRPADRRARLRPRHRRCSASCSPTSSRTAIRSSPITGPRAWPAARPRLDRWVWLFQFVLIDGKLRGLFTLLFGAGIYLFMERAWARGRDARLQARRLLWLGAVRPRAFLPDLVRRHPVRLRASPASPVLPMLQLGSRAPSCRVGLAWYAAGALALAALLGQQAALESMPRAQAAAAVGLRRDAGGHRRDARRVRRTNIRVMREGQLRRRGRLPRADRERRACSRRRSSR